MMFPKLLQEIGDRMPPRLGSHPEKDRLHRFLRRLLG